MARGATSGRTASRLLLGATCVLITVASAVARADPSDADGEVRVPLTRYQQMVAQLQQVPAPAEYAIAGARVSVSVAERDGRWYADVDARFTVETFADRWVAVLLLPPGTAVSRARVDGKPVQLVTAPDGLAWLTRRAGVVEVQLEYAVAPLASRDGYTLAVPVPRAASIQFAAGIPQTDVDLAAVPALNPQLTVTDNATALEATIPPTSSVLLSWRMAGKQDFVVSRARYSGELSGNAVVWKAILEVDVLTARTVRLPLLAATMALSDVRVDGHSSSVFEHEGQFVTTLSSPGRHRVEIAFDTPVQRFQGTPSVRLQVSRVPVSHFTLTLPAGLELSASPAGHVLHQRQAERTVASVYLPMADSVDLAWKEAVPEHLRAKVRATASLYHLFYAEEGVLTGRALIEYDVAHGEMSSFTLDVPADVQINRIDSPSGAIVDWTVDQDPDSAHKRVTVFAARPVSGRYLLKVEYERLLEHASTAGFAVPVMRAADLHRQRGMVVLLAAPELALTPVSEQHLTRVGENQIPAFVRERLALPVAHTFKYALAPTLQVTAASPPRLAGKFDAQVDTLASIGEVAIRGSATVEINVKSGALRALTLQLPVQVNVLAVSGPSLRTHTVTANDRGVEVRVEFTRDMQGQFRLEVGYERILGENPAATTVPTLEVVGAQTEHGRIAVEALIPVEIKPAAAERMTAIDVGDLPRQLIFKTTNPILLAYKYVRAGAPAALRLTITHHEQLATQVATIERAHYTSLYTRDGFTVTAATLLVRNTRRQFLRLALPPGAEVWSVFVDGREEKPAAVDAATQDNVILIKLVNSALGFPVELVYAAPAAPLASMGTVAGALPDPDMVVTHTRWDVFLPERMHYRALDTTLDVVVDGTPAPRRGPTLDLASLIQAARATERTVGEPLRIDVPRQGVQFSFEKLYAGQSPAGAQFSVRYASAGVNRLAVAVSLVAVALVWIGIVAVSRGALRSRRSAGALIGTGVLLLIGALGFAGASFVYPSAFSLLIALALAIRSGLQRLVTWRAA